MQGCREGAGPPEQRASIVATCGSTASIVAASASIAFREALAKYCRSTRTAGAKVWCGADGLSLRQLPVLVAEVNSNSEIPCGNRVLTCACMPDTSSQDVIPGAYSVLM